MSVLSILKSINTRTLQATPYVITAAQAAEAMGPHATGSQKAEVVTQAVIQTMGASSSPTAQELAGTISLVVLVANLIGAFKKSPTGSANTADSFSLKAAQGAAVAGTAFASADGVAIQRQSL